MADDTHCPGTRIRYEEERPCKLHPTSKYAEEKARQEALKDIPESKCKDHKPKEPVECPDCGWKSLALYAIPLLLYVPWAYHKMKCTPQCCPLPVCCPKVSCPPKQNTCCGPMPTKVKETPPKQDMECKKEKTRCQQH